MIFVAIIAILMTMGLALIRACKGPTAYDRMLAANMVGTKAVLLIAVGGYALNWSGFADIALLYALINFISTIAVMRFFEYQKSSSDLSGE
ncbi:monovalent cation/H+ antiporter complex subunit F [uncultured Neptuniibacter sp.]|uniref:monovalent cation/H+ antiporter complex subunit F n=1 Tax=uncultured Neptuniibacter sp. TaxID=502143 RepID=UPI00261DA438|nr:monovalent cation/H+ antiporter complex subunit F [uncultured Neptuniibacter sp.]